MLLWLLLLLHQPRMKHIVCPTQPACCCSSVQIIPDGAVVRDSKQGSLYVTSTKKPALCSFDLSTRECVWAV